MTSFNTLTSLRIPSTFPPDPDLLITIACRLHDTRRGINTTRRELMKPWPPWFRPSEIEQTLQEYCWDSEHLSGGRPSARASRNPEYFVDVMGEKGWSKEESIAWLRDYLWLKQMLGRESARIVEEMSKSREERAEDEKMAAEEREDARVERLMIKDQARTKKMTGNDA